MPPDHPLPLAAGWNLVSYLPRVSLSVTVALQSIDGQYTVVQGFDHGALSYYPDLPPGLNTLQVMVPLHGYWIRTIDAVTLTYPISASVSASSLTSTGAPPNSQSAIRNSKSDIPLPTNTWVDFYGATGATMGAVIWAIDPDGVVCGATVVTIPGQYGLLACYGDDPDTPADEGAQPGDVIRVVVEDSTLGTGIWMGPGERQQVMQGQQETSRRLFLPLISALTPSHPLGLSPIFTPSPSPTLAPSLTPLPSLYLPLIETFSASPPAPAAALVLPTPEAVPTPPDAVHRQWLPILLQEVKP